MSFDNASNLRLEHEFDRRVEEFHLQTNGNDHEEERITIIPVSDLYIPQPAICCHYLNISGFCRHTGGAA